MAALVVSHQGSPSDRKVAPASAMAARVLSRSRVHRASLSSLQTTRASPSARVAMARASLLAVSVCAANFLGKHSRCASFTQRRLLSVKGLAISADTGTAYDHWRWSFPLFLGCLLRFGIHSVHDFCTEIVAWLKGSSACASLLTSAQRQRAKPAKCLWRSQPQPRAFRGEPKVSIRQNMDDLGRDIVKPHALCLKVSLDFFYCSMSR